MAENGVILVTGVAGFWGSRVASQLLAQTSSHVIGLDNEPPKEVIKGLDFIQADIRNPLLLELIKSENIDTLVHLAFLENNSPSEIIFDSNVIGTMKTLIAAERAGVRKIILRSSTTVYGANPDNPAFLSEEHPLRGSNHTGYIRDLLEIESFCNGFRLQAPQVKLTVLRFPNVIGPSVDSPMTRFLRPTIVPVLLGFEPQMQFLHENDAIDAILYAIEQDIPGVFNIAAEGVLPLDKLLAMTGRIPVPIFHLFMYWSRAATGNTRISHLTPIELDYIRYTWVADIRRMRNEYGYTPKYTAEEAIREYAGHLRMRSYMPESTNIKYDEERLRDTIERRNRLRMHNRVAGAQQEVEEVQSNG